MAPGDPVAPGPRSIATGNGPTGAPSYRTAA